MAGKSVKALVAVLGASAVLAAGVGLGRRSAGGPGEPAGGPPTSAVPDHLVEFREEQAGWAISYPRGWNRLEPADAAVVLVVSQHPPEVNSGGSLLARNLTLAAPVDEAGLDAARRVTDGIVRRDGIDLLAGPTVIHQGGLPGFFYFYSFRDPATGREGVHSHYFLFKGATMVSFVFQALPKDDFQGLAPLFDDVVGSFRLL